MSTPAAASDVAAGFVGEPWQSLGMLEVFHPFREGPGRPLVPGGASLNRPDQEIGSKVEQIEAELVGVENLDAVRLGRGLREVGEVGRDQDLGAGMDGGSQDMTILKSGLGNLAATGIDNLTAIVKTRLKRIQHHPEVLDGFLAQTGFSLQPLPP
jgi:hypothetical protein